jgi:hypothetical protein
MLVVQQEDREYAEALRRSVAEQHIADSFSLNRRSFVAPSSSRPETVDDADVQEAIKRSLTDTHAVIQQAAPPARTPRPLIPAATAAHSLSTFRPLREHKA